MGDSPLTGITRNPWNPTKTPGGSSAGGAAGVAAGVTPLALATDGGGSTRIPASFCGVFGIKPQLGRIPYVPIGATPSLNHVGIIANSVQDAATLLTVVAGGDLRDPQSIPCPMDAPVLNTDIGGLRAAWSPNLGYATLDPEVLKTVEEGVQTLRDLGVDVQEVEAPFDDPAALWESAFMAGAGARLGALLDGHPDVIDPAVIRQLAGAKDQTLADYLKKAQERYAFHEQVRAFFDAFDLLITPTSPVPAFDVGRNTPPGLRGLDQDNPTGWLFFTYPFNVSGHPAASVPCGFNSAGLPVGMQLVSRAFDETTALRTAAALEAVSPWMSRRAEI